MMRGLYTRLALAFAALTLVCGGFSGWVYRDMTARHQQEVLQRLSKDLAGHIAGHTDLVRELKWNRAAVDDLFHMLMVVNPGIEVYLLDAQGGIDAHVAPPGRVRLERVDLQAVRAFLGGARMPVLGDDPRHPGARKIFSAAELRQNGVLAGYLYVVLAGEAYDALAADVWASQAFTTAAWLSGGLLVLTLLAGLAAFAFITRRLRALTVEVADLQADPARAPPDTPLPPPARADEIGDLQRAFRAMAARIQAQVGELKRQDSLRREMVANISHDLRTPLTSLQGYLETLQRKEGQLAAEERARYLDTAVRHSRKVSKLAQELFELAKLECEVVKPQTEAFSLAEVVQDVLQKFELPAREREVRLDARIDPALPAVKADIGLIERVLTNLIDNALRHTPPHGEVLVELTAEPAPEGDTVRVRVRDTGIGVPAEKRADLFERPSPVSDSRGRAAGGLGLLIVKRILNLHGSHIRLEDTPEPGAAFSFALPAA